MMRFVIQLESGMYVTFPRHMPDDGAEKYGWRPLNWTRDVLHAEHFKSERLAHQVAKAWLGHDRWKVVLVDLAEEKVLS